MCEHGTIQLVDVPSWWNSPRPSVGLDDCIAETVVALWECGVVTLGSCCGHGRDRPSLVLSEDRDMPEKARRAIEEFDQRQREWTLLQWQLVDVSNG